MIYLDPSGLVEMQLGYLFSPVLERPGVTEKGPALVVKS